MKYIFTISNERGTATLSLKSDWEAPAKIKASGSKELISEFKYWLETCVLGPFGHFLHFNAIFPSDLYFALFGAGKEKFNPVLVEGEVKEITGPGEGQVF